MLTTITPLTSAQSLILDEEMKFSPTSELMMRPVRFMADGQNVDIVTGACAPRGSNVLYHVVYWDTSKSFATSVLDFLGINNPGIRFKISNH